MGLYLTMFTISMMCQQDYIGVMSLNLERHQPKMHQLKLTGYYYALYVQMMVQFSYILIVVKDILILELEANQETGVLGTY